MMRFERQGSLPSSRKASTSNHRSNSEPISKRRGPRILRPNAPNDTIRTGCWQGRSSPVDGIVSMTHTAPGCRFGHLTALPAQATVAGHGRPGSSSAASW
ncbi:hypothetical protein CONLIGDRAFT_142567 [Coniochaeta ligniaria NRRL 30616]|uniref:Uncharacterized protein n=1 Tax=Coniochaeta ligniaria NRRL 30616 TaxID=1408157 RepID=A0A1J7I6S2_9PEZI|nr:hypothetical protein CONLIGDRAFT_142567 [Coniochaeta ligniaria NRRL 30616]